MRIIDLEVRNVKAAVLTVIILAMCFLSACQPTPKSSAVIGRQQDILENVSSVPSGEFKKIDTPQHISKKYENFAKLKVTFDADVSVPETNAYPVTEVNKRRFADNDILSLIKLFTGSDKIYSKWDLNKSEWQQMITEVKPYVASGKINKTYLNALQKDYDNADTTVRNTQVDISNFPKGKLSTAYIPNGNNRVSKFMFTHDDNEFIYYRDLFLEAYPESLYSDFGTNEGTKENKEWMLPGEPEISKEDAYKEALKYVNELNAGLELYSSEPCTVLVNQVQKSSGWIFIFTRKIAGLVTQYEDGVSEMNPDSLPSYGAPWKREALKIIIDKKGLCKLWWQGASAVSKTDAQSTELKPFTDITDRIAEQLNYIYGTQEKDGNGLDVSVTKIELGTSLISAKDQTESGVYIPTWYVSFKYKWRNEGESEIDSTKLMFSALDGSYIEPRVTNNDLM